MEKHKPVMVKEILGIIERERIKEVIDGTYGTGGHSIEFKERGLEVIGFDLDEDSLKYNIGIELHIDSYSNILKYIEEPKGLLLIDLGFNSNQLESIEGLSYLREGGLDMRYNRTENNKPTRQEAKSIIEGELNNKYSLKDLLPLFTEEEIRIYLRKHEVKNSREVSSKIFNYLIRKPLETTTELNSIIGKDYKDLSVVYQAFRILINNELKELEKVLRIRREISEKLIVITFNSLERKLVERYRYKEKYNVSKEESESNIRSRSAVMYYL